MACRHNREMVFLSCPEMPLIRTQIIENNRILTMRSLSRGLLLFTGPITSNYRQILHPDQPMNVILSSIVGGVNEQKKTL